MEGGKGVSSPFGLAARATAGSYRAMGATIGATPRTRSATGARPLALTLGLAARPLALPLARLTLSTTLTALGARLAMGTGASITPFLAILTTRSW